MSISTYSELQDAVGNFLARDDLKAAGSLAARTEEFIVLFEAYVNRTLETRNQEQRMTATLSQGDEYIALPTAFGGIRNIQVNDDPLDLLMYMAPEQLDTQYPGMSTRPPKAYTIIGQEIQIKPITDKDLTLEIITYETLPALSDSNTSNWLLSNDPDIYLSGSLAYAYKFLGDLPKASAELTLVDRFLEDRKNKDKRARWSGASMVTRTDIPRLDRHRRV